MKRPGKTDAPVPFPELSFGYFSALDTACADAKLACSATNLGLDRAQIHAPTAAADVVRVRDVVAELRTLAADFTDLCHDRLQEPELFVRTFNPQIPMPRCGRSGYRGHGMSVHSGAESSV